MVASVDKYPANVPNDLDDFFKTLNFLNRTRDGHGTPDLFYLAQIPGKQGRYCARFDAIFTIQVPTDEAVRKQFLQNRRIGTLSPDFRRDLHARLFGAFASLGFDDNHWFSSEDLIWLIAKGMADLKSLEAKEATHAAAEAGNIAENKQAGKSDGQELIGIQKKIGEMKERLAPFQAALDSRPKLLAVADASPQ